MNYKPIIKDGLTQCFSSDPEEQKDCPDYKPKDKDKGYWICSHFRDLGAHLWWCDFIEPPKIKDK